MQSISTSSESTLSLVDAFTTVVGWSLVGGSVDDGTDGFLWHHDSLLITVVMEKSFNISDRNKEQHECVTML